MIQAISSQMITSWRRWLHMHPETAGKEKNTASYLAEELSKMGLPVRENIFGYGLMAELTGKEDGKCIALRADMDALPVTEQTNLEYKSLTPGVMHACGHDAHMAMLLATAAELAQDPPPGRVKFIFQPREEKPPGGGKYMVEAGVLKNPDADAVICLHVSPNYPVGTVAIKEGIMTGIADDFELIIHGKGGHGATPHLTNDPIIITAQVIQGIQHIISRRVDPTEPALLSLGTIHGGTAQNIIPDQVVLTGTVRSTKQAVRERIINLLHQTLTGITEAWDADYTLDYVYGYPPVINDPRITRLIMDVVQGQPALHLHVMEKPVMIGEDFAYFAKEVPSAFFFFGCGSETKNNPLHHSSFDIEEACLPLGVKVMTEAVREFLNK